MKKYQRRLSLLLCALIILSCTLSCSETGSGETETTPVSAPTTDTTVDTAAESETEYIGDDLPSPDYDGYAFRILSCNFYDKELATYMTFDEMTGVPVDDALYESKMYLEDRFNIGISWIETGDTSAGQTTARTAINAGDDAFDILIGHDGNTVGLGKEGLLRNMYDFEQFNFEKPWWPEHAVESWTVAGKLYAASSYISYCGLHWTRAIIFNKEWAEDLNMEMPYDAVREGRWTLDMLNTITEDVSYDYDGNGKMNEKDKVGFTSGGQTWYCLQEAVDLPIYRRDANGEIYIDTDIERAEKYVTIMREITSKDRYVSSGDFGTKMFENGNALFAYTQVGDAYDYIRISDIKYGFLPTPKLDELQEDYINCGTDVPWGIPKTVVGAQEDIVGTICEAMSCYNYNNVLPAYFEVALKSRAADAPDDAEMLQIISDTRTIGFAYGYGLLMNNILGDLMNSNQEVASYFKSKEKASSKALEKMVMQFEEME